MSQHVLNLLFCLYQMTGHDQLQFWSVITSHSCSHGADFWRAFHGSSGSNSWFTYTSSGHWSPRRTNSPLESFACTLNCLSTSDKRRNRIKRTHSGFFQSKPAEQRSAPITGWWKPLFVLTFRERGGTKATSLGVTHFKMAPFKLFVLSALAVDIPFWIYSAWDK